MTDASAWRSRKTRLNHRVLHNQFILSLRAVQSKLEIAPLSAEREDELLGEILPRWHSIRHEIDALMATMDVTMSPTLFFHVPPLDALPSDSHGWLQEVAVALWRSRNGTGDLIEGTSLQLSNVDTIHAELTAGWSAFSQSERRERVERLADACIAVSEELSRLPSTRGM